MADLMQTLALASARFFAAMFVLTIMVSGIRMMVVPSRAPEVLKRTAVAIGLFALGVLLARNCFWA